MAVRRSLPPASVIQLPGVFSTPTDPSSALRALGGVPALTAWHNNNNSSNNQSPALSLYTKPASISAPIPCTDTMTTTHFVLNLSTSCLMARAIRSTSFTTPSDFALTRIQATHPPHEAIYHLALPHSLPKRTDAIDRLRPSRFARQAPDGHTVLPDYWFRQHGLDTATPATQASLPKKPHLDRRSAANRLALLPHRIRLSSETVPSSPPPQPPVQRSVEAFTQLVAILRKQFERRPVWIRRALHDGVPARLRKCFIRAIATVAYSFQGAGPFHQAWIRYGYDPRKSPQDRRLQVIEIRCNHPVVRAAVKEKRKAATGKGDLQGEGECDFRLPEAYRLSGIPLHKNNFVQVCDISIPAVVRFCTSEPIQEHFDRKFGFFSGEGHRKLIGIVKEALVENARNSLGNERVQKILLPYTSAGVTKKKRARTTLGQVMKPKVATSSAAAVRSIIVGTQRNPRLAAWRVDDVSRMVGLAQKSPAEFVENEEQGGGNDETSNHGDRAHESEHERLGRAVEAVALHPDFELYENDMGHVAADNDADLEFVEAYEILGDSGDYSDSDDDDEEDEGAIEKR